MRNITIVALVLLLVVGLVGTLYLNDFFTTRTGGDSHNITDMASSYNADAEIARALDAMKTGNQQAKIITGSSTGLRHIALTFDGLTDRTTIQQILDLLKKYNMKATFFVEGLQTAEDPQTVINIKQAGHSIENYTLSGLARMESLTVERLVRDFCRAHKIIKVTTNQGPNFLKCNDTEYTGQLLQAAKACGFNGVIKSDVFIDIKQLRSSYDADILVSSIKPGSIVSIKLKTAAEPIVNEPGKTNLRPAIDKQPGLKKLPQQGDLGDKKLVNSLEKFLIALKKANYPTVFLGELSNNNLLKDNKSSLIVRITALIKKQLAALLTCRTAYAAELAASDSKEIKMVFTAEPALSYTFGGLSNAAVVNDVLKKLHQLGIKATFFIMETEMKMYPETVRKIIENEHEIGIAIRPKDNDNFDDIAQGIIRSRNILQEQFGVTTNLVKQPWGAVSDTTKDAVSALNCKFIGQSVNVVQSKHKDYISAEQVIGEIFGKSVFSLARGQIVHFRMDYYTDDRLVGQLLVKIKQHKIDNIAYVTSYDNPASNPANDSQYSIKPVGEILNNTKFIYTYPIVSKAVPAQLRDGEAAVSINTANFLSESSKRYIGNEDVNDEDRILGFSKMETRRLDKSGVIHTNDNIVFLTFDDWGTDASVNKILYILRKHNVPGTFFVLTNNVLNNPNLLRAIAVEGHDIGSHSDKHKPMAVRDPITGKQVKTLDKADYIQDFTTAYKKLRDVTGDVSINGKPALTRFFRPPTIAISKIGFEALFETGYEYIVSGSGTTYDYEAKSVQQLVGTIKDGIYKGTGEVKKGAILIMHMGDSCLYTPVALDILLTANEAKADSDPSKFKVGRLSDYLPAGYSQINRKLSLRLNSHH